MHARYRTVCDWDVQSPLVHSLVFIDTCVSTSSSRFSFAAYTLSCRSQWARVTITTSQDDRCVSLDLDMHFYGLATRSILLREHLFLLFLLVHQYLLSSFKCVGLIDNRRCQSNAKELHKIRCIPYALLLARR